MTTPIDTAAREVLALAEKATPGEWRTDGHKRKYVVAFGRGGKNVCRPGAQNKRAGDDDDMVFIAHTRTSAPLLAACVLRRGALVAECQATLRDFRSSVGGVVQEQLDSLLTRLEAERGT